MNIQFVVVAVVMGLWAAPARADNAAATAPAATSGSAEAGLASLDAPSNGVSAAVIPASAPAGETAVGETPAATPPKPQDGQDANAKAPCRQRPAAPMRGPSPGPCRSRASCRTSASP